MINAQSRWNFFVGKIYVAAYPLRFIFTCFKLNLFAKVHQIVSLIILYALVLIKNNEKVKTQTIPVDDVIDRILFIQGVFIAQF